MFLRSTFFLLVYAIKVPDTVVHLSVGTLCLDGCKALAGGCHALSDGNQHIGLVAKLIVVYDKLQKCVVEVSRGATDVLYECSQVM